MNKGTSSLSGEGTTPTFLECNECGKKCFGRNRKQNLAHHMITHNNDRNIVCQMCPYRASSITQLLRHMSQIHSKVPYDISRNVQALRLPVQSESFTASSYPMLDKTQQ